jgi:dTDP-4-dehydrorhamnose 3,5-epimerase
MMRVPEWEEKIGIEGVQVFFNEPKIDERGAFMECSRESQFEPGFPQFVQDNAAVSLYGVIRGMHFQKEKPQGKLIRCLMGEIFDCFVDLRPDSKTFKKSGRLILGGMDGISVYLPPGLAHGYFTLTQNALIHYKCTEYYYPELDAGINALDPELGIEWPSEAITSSIRSLKDRKLPSMSDYLGALG